MMQLLLHWFEGWHRLWALLAAQYSDQKTIFAEITRDVSGTHLEQTAPIRSGCLKEKSINIHYSITLYWQFTEFFTLYTSPHLLVFDLFRVHVQQPSWYLVSASWYLADSSCTALPYTWTQWHSLQNLLSWANTELQLASPGKKHAHCYYIYLSINSETFNGEIMWTTYMCKINPTINSKNLDTYYVAINSFFIDNTDGDSHGHLTVKSWHLYNKSNCYSLRKCKSWIKFVNSTFNVDQPPLFIFVICAAQL